jgi:hypothetical protein
MKKQIKKELERLTNRLAQIEKLESLGVSKKLSEVDLSQIEILSSYTMGEKFSIQFKGEILIEQDYRREYTGRGAKYNKNIRHGNIVIDILTKKDLFFLLENLHRYTLTNNFKQRLELYKNIDEVLKKYSTGDNISNISINTNKPFRAVNLLGLSEYITLAK